MHFSFKLETVADSFFLGAGGQVRGDIARALFYMDVRYEGEQENGAAAAGETPDLVLSDEPNVATAHMGLLSSLTRWHQLDPPSASEEHRNGLVCSRFQHNRNPFVDHPEYVARIWDQPQALVALASSEVPTAASGGVTILPSAGAGLAVGGKEGQQAPFPGAGPIDNGLGQGGGGAVSSGAGPAPLSLPATAASSAWINEFHYENEGPDEGEVGGTPCFGLNSRSVCDSCEGKRTL
eukprot:TRINITY_DN2557_c0_g1_i1.p1 TRINITY_DN2557_c0_g1~~TRINITY_DN2557_c0_g1_i1.p1  ORF type:complete len:237 (+),score=50.42 TRINITY_DN2557_c0_g1_i1:113-823(+)